MIHTHTVAKVASDAITRKTFSGMIGYHPDTRISLYVGFAWIALLLIGWVFKRRRERQLAQA